MADQSKHSKRLAQATPTDRSGLVVVRADGDLRAQALTLLLSPHTVLQSSAEPESQTVQRFRSYADEQNLSLDETWLAFDGGRALASVLIVPSAGRTGMIFLSPILTRKQSTAAAEAAQAACREQVRSKAHLVQALLEPSQRLAAQALRAAGFHDLATLIYMQHTPAPESSSSQTLDLKLRGPEIKVYHWHERHWDRFADAIAATYEQTSDCPGLVGLRTMPDIIAGHRAAGIFDPDLWLALWCDDDPVGVMLLNKLPTKSALELVYLGIAPRWRRRGLGRQLLEHGLALAKQCHLPDMLLAVDQSNAGALHMYRAMRFVETGRKLALLKVVD
jgi:mycothiol synthase